MISFVTICVLIEKKLHGVVNRQILSTLSNLQIVLANFGTYKSEIDFYFWEKTLTFVYGKKTNQNSTIKLLVVNTSIYEWY